MVDVDGEVDGSRLGETGTQALRERWGEVWRELRGAKMEGRRG